MTRAVHAFFLALRDLPNPRVLRILLQSLALTLFLLIVVGAALYFAARWAMGYWGWLGAAEQDMAGLLVVLLIVAGSWLLFRVVAIVVVGLFADAIVADVEGRHYPAAAARAVDVGWRQNIGLALASLVRLIGGNLLALPIYVVLLVTGIGTPIFALFVNGLLLGRDLEAMVLARHPGRPRFDRPARWSLGLLSAASFVVPVANLLAPIVSAAMAVHMLHLASGDPNR
ncbi:EI24 domain-containing protein [Sphingopyxis microcysteis]|uniref:EI24 domain-containing protein n=1 Tax=Sphingopyxis microcysteis TaxID=2484145 RepID=UPI001446A7AA|nr:EI24 domain-containing protein [Sphingopyxis microcysteis]